MRAGNWWLADRRAVAAAVLAAHLALLWFMQRQLLQPPLQPVHATRLLMEVWLTPPTSVLPKSRAQHSAPIENKPRFDRSDSGSSTRGRSSGRQPLSAPAAQPAVDDPTPAFAGTPAAAEPASAPVSAAPVDTTPLLDTAATRRAIRESARSPGSLAQQAVEEGAELRSPTAAARLPGAMEGSGKGDCAKGEFAGGGMGLLSLPFLAAAAMKGDCAK